MAKKFKWGTENQCGFIGCNEKIDWGWFTSYLACENHWNRKWGLCEACQTEKTTHTDYYNIYHDSNKAEREPKEVKEGINFQKEIIEKLFSENISASLREKLNAAYEKAQETEKIIPELERLTSEYWDKKLNCASYFIKEKGGQQTNIYESNLCDKCGDEVNERQLKLKNDYRVNVLNKLVVFDSETTTQIKKEISEVQNIAMDFVQGNKEGILRYSFMSKLPFFKSEKNAAWHQSRQNKKAAFLKLKQYFQNHSIKQIKEIGSSNYFVIWYVDGNNEKKYGSFLPVDWSNFTWKGYKSISLHEINRVLTDLEQEPIPKEEEKPVGRNNQPENNTSQLSELDKGLIKRYFIKNKIKKIVFKNGELIITHNNNEIVSQDQLNNLELQLIKDNLQKNGKNELVSQDLGIKSDNTSTGSNNSKPRNYQLTIGLTLGAGAVILVGMIFYFARKRKKR